MTLAQWIRSEKLLVLLVLAWPLLWVIVPLSPGELAGLVHWKTIAALAGLMVLSRGLEDSGFLNNWGRVLLSKLHSERALAAFLVIFSAVLSMVITNDVALFIVVPLTLALGSVARIPVARLVIFEALAVNAGSSISPIGNPQNLFLWQTSGASLVEFTAAMLPIGLALTAMLLLAIPLAFASHRISLDSFTPHPGGNRVLLVTSLVLYLPLLILVEQGHAVVAAVAVIALFLITFRQVLRGVDWPLLLVFILMFTNLGLLAKLPLLQTLGNQIESWPGGAFSAGVLFSQIISNVPAAIFLDTFTDDWQSLAWGVSVGGFGLAIGSLANLIALRLARQPGMLLEFHRWSIPALLAGCLLAWLLVGMDSIAS
ncbi:MAG: SLC13 family permease [Wenzhouxiangella sp.]